MNYQRQFDHQKWLHKEYDNYLNMTETQRQDYIAMRRIELRKSCDNQDIRYISSSGTRSKPKYYRWGPYFNETYRFVLDVVTNFSVKPRTVINLMGMEYSDITAVSYQQDTCETHFTDHMLYITAGITRIETYFDKYLGGHDIIVDPNILLLLNKRCNLLDHVGDTTFYFTGSILTDELLKVLNGRWKYYDWMRSWDGGATFFTCRYGNKHWFDFLADTYITSDGRLISTDLYNQCDRFIDYFNNDIVETNAFKGVCRCGLKSMDIRFQDYGRSVIAIAPNGQSYSYASLRTLLNSVLDGFVLHDVTYSVESQVLTTTILGIGDKVALQDRYTDLVIKRYQFRDVVYKNYLDTGRKIHLLKVKP